MFDTGSRYLMTQDCVASRTLVVTGNSVGLQSESRCVCVYKRALQVCSTLTGHSGLRFH